MKRFYILPIIALLFLQACQHHEDFKEESKETKKAKLSDAASYNTQLGLAYLNQGDRPRAKRKLLLALSQAPHSPTVNASMAYFMEKTGELKEANLYYQKAMAEAPGDGAQLNNYGTFLCRQGQYKEAESYFLKAVKDINYDHTAGAYENAGLCARAIPDEAKALSYFNKALEQDPSRAQSLYEILRLEMKEEHLNEALAYLKKYPMLVTSERTLLDMALEIAHKAGKVELEADYRLHLHRYSDNTGGKNEYNSNNG